MNDVISAAGSVDARGTYVFEVEGRAGEQRLSKQSPYWTVKNGSNAMVALWNPSGNAEDVVATLNYAGGSGMYNFPVHLAPYATVNLDIEDVINDQSADAAGNVIPKGVQEGSLSFHDATSLERPVFLNVSVGIFNVVKGTCYWGWIDCDGYSSILINPNPISLGAGESIYPEAEGQYSDGTTPGVDASWTISNSSVATVSDGYLTGVTAGTATLTATANPSLPVSGMYYGYNPSCDELQTYEAFTASVTVSVFDPTPVITKISNNANASSVFTVGALATAQVTGYNLGTTKCPTLTFPFTLLISPLAPLSLASGSISLPSTAPTQFRSAAR